MSNSIRVLNHSIPIERGIFCNRTLNLKKIQAIGYDMDYTLVHYNVAAWEGQAYQQIQRDLVNRGWPINHLVFNPNMAIRGLVIDRELGNIVKVNRFGYVKQAMHGTRVLDFDEVRKVYARIMVDLAESRYEFLNTLFSISEGCIYCQLVDLLDSGKIPGVLGYTDLHQTVIKSLNQAHMEGELKREIISHPDQYVLLDPETPLTLLDQKQSGKKLLLITNSEWHYTKPMMSYAFDRFLPDGMTWRDLFDLCVVSASKPGFFSGNAMMFKLATEEGLLEMCRTIRSNGIYLGGSATKVEEFLGISGEEILYVGDHIFADVNISKSVLRWRTALIVKELEEELKAVAAAKADQKQIHAYMNQKEDLEAAANHIYIQIQRIRRNYGPAPIAKIEELEAQARNIRTTIQEIDAQLQPLLIKEEQRFRHNWGYMMRTGNDKSHLMRQIERHADIYMSRVSNFLAYTPFMYFRSPRSSLPHDMNND